MSFLFQGQRSNEEVLLVTHKHPFVLLHHIIVGALLLLIPVLAWRIALVGPLLLYTLIICLPIALFYLYVGWYGWNRTLLLITNERVVFLEQRGLFQREMIECNMGNIQQVQHHVDGIMHTLFGYGNLIMSSGGSAEPIKIKDMPDPYQIQQEIQRATVGETDYMDEPEDESGLVEPEASNISDEPVVASTKPSTTDKK